MIEVLVLRLLFQPELHQVVDQHRRQLKWAARHGQGNFHWDILDTILLYDEKYAKLPSRKSLLEFCSASADTKMNNRRLLIEPPVRELTTAVPQEAVDAISDMDVLVDFVVEEARKEWYIAIFQGAIRKIHQGKPAGKAYPPGEGLFGPEGAVAYIQRMLSDDLCAPNREAVVMGDVDEI